MITGIPFLNRALGLLSNILITPGAGGQAELIISLSYEGKVNFDYLSQVV